jgi:hypothetical protein
MPQTQLTPDSYMAQQGQVESSPRSGSALTPDSFMAQQQPSQPSATPKPSSDPSQPGMISRAWNWMMSPFGVIDQADQAARQQEQHENDEAAMHSTPEDDQPKWWLGGYSPLKAKVFAQDAAAGTVRDAVKTVGSPMGALGAVTGPLAAAGEAGEVPSLIAKAARVAQGVESAPFVATGAYHAGQGVKEALPKSIGGGGESVSNPEVAAKLSGGLAEMAGGAAGVASAVHPPKLHFTEEQIRSYDHDVARGVQKHLADFATQEKKAAGADIAADDEQLDQAFPTGVVDGQQIFQQVNPMRKELFPAGGRPEPKILSRVEGAAQGKNPVPQNVLNDFLERGVITPEDTARTWSASQSRAIEGSLWQEARRYARAKDFRSAKVVRDLASQIHDARQNAAESINIGADFKQHNDRYSQYMDTFVNGPLRKVITANNADGVLNPFISQNAENIRRQLMPYDGPVNVKGLRDVAEFHGKVKDAFAPGNGGMKNRLLTSAGMMAIGMGIGHPFLGLIGASMAGRQAIGTALAKGEVASQAEHLPIEPLSDKYSLPMPQRGMFAGKVARGAVTFGTPAANEVASSDFRVPPSMILQAAQSAQTKPGPYGKPHFINHATGQRLKANGDGSYTDVDTGRPHDWQYVRGKQ